MSPLVREARSIETLLVHKGDALAGELRRTPWGASFAYLAQYADRGDAQARRVA